MRKLPLLLLLHCLSQLTFSQGNVGIGTAEPKARLHVTDSSVVFSAAGDTLLSPGSSPLQGSGRRFMWYADKAAFRTGYTGLSDWNQANIGAYSIAAGKFTRATGLYSVAMGISAQAKGNGAIALGGSVVAEGNHSLATGWFTTASGATSTALGSLSTATGDYSTAFGLNALASDIGCIAMGYNAKATKTYSIAIGYEVLSNSTSALATGFRTTASGPYATAMGFSTIASREGATATGFETKASGFYATAMGNNTTASGDNSTAIGHRAVANSTGATAIGNYVSTNGSAGCLVLGDNSTTTYMYSGGANGFRARFAGGYRFFTTSNTSTTAAPNAYLAAGDNAWSTSSSIYWKENFAPLNGEDFLREIKAMKLVSWNYKGQDPKTYRHYGPMAQDFYAAFGKDEYGTIGNDTTINGADFDGVNLIAIQALEKRTAELQKENEQLKARLERLERLLPKQE